MNQPEIDAIKSQLATTQEALRQSEAACAVMREQLQRFEQAGFGCGDALSTSAGKSLLAELEQCRRDRDAATHEANRRDQKWMEGIDMAVGRKLDYGEPCSRDNAQKALEAIVKELEQCKARLVEAEWLIKNATPGIAEAWIERRDKWARGRKGES